MLPASLFLLLAFLGNAYAKHFQEWYKQRDYVYEDLINSECKSQYSSYMTGWSIQENCDPECLIDKIMDCLLNNTREGFKADMASACVLLGLLPSILSMVSPTIVEMELLIQRRPLPSIIAGLGVPSVSFIHTFGYHSGPSELFRETPGAIKLPKFSRRWRLIIVLIVLIQYILVCGCVVNLLLVTLELSRRTVCKFKPRSEILPLMWAMAGTLLQCFASITYCTSC